MSIWRSVMGAVRVRVLTADPAQLLHLLNTNDIRLEQVEIHDLLTLEVTVDRLDYSKLKKLLISRGEKPEILYRIGVYWSCKGLLKRPILVFGMFVFLFLSIYLPGRVLFVQVRGNEAIPTRLILEKASSCGIKFGASRVDVRSERIKNALLESLPQLQWAGVNTTGCVAIISVKEKNQQESSQMGSTGVSSIVAARDGLILECTVTKGNPLCTVGQAVKAGQTLVSGYTDCGISISATRADAEIYALTERHIQVCTPVNLVKRGKLIRTETVEYFQVGKKLINFNNNSRISDTTCVKIYNKYAVTLPGGFSLPVYWITQTSYYYEMLPAQTEDPYVHSWLAQFSEEYLTGQMVAGRILETVDREQLLDEVYVYEADYACYEMIGQVKEEEIIQ